MKSRGTSFLDSINGHYLVGMKDVTADGHCGFRAVAGLLDFWEDLYSRVRCDLSHHLGMHQAFYKHVFVEKRGVKDTLKALHCFEPVAPYSNWFTLPDMGHLVASTYNVALVVFSPEMSLTYLPLQTGIPASPKVICMSLINQSHFVQVTLKYLFLNHTCISIS